MAHGDFYFTINATFYHFTDSWGEKALLDYWQELGSSYLRPLAKQFQEGGLSAVAQYWSDYFTAEPFGDVQIHKTEHAIMLEVKVCPAIRWLRESKDSVTHPPIHPMYCKHCQVINSAMLEHTDYEFTLEGGEGSCQQTFSLKMQNTRSEVAS
jgi:hypothetical protein